MSGYRNATIRLDFPELAEDDEQIFVVIRNPKLLPLAFWDNDVDLDNGPPAYVEPAVAGETPDEAQARLDRNYDRTVARSRAVAERATKASLSNYARLIQDCHVIAGDGEDRFDGEVSTEQIGRLPQIILTRIAGCIQESMPKVLA